MEKLLLNITIKRLVAIVNEGYYEELIELTKFDSNFRDTLIEVEKQLNPNKSDTYNEELLALFENFEFTDLKTSLQTTINFTNFATAGSFAFLNKIFNLSKLFLFFSYAGALTLIVFK